MHIVAAILYTKSDTMIENNFNVLSKVMVLIVWQSAIKKKKDKFANRRTYFVYVGRS